MKPLILLTASVFVAAIAPMGREVVASAGEPTVNHNWHQWRGPEATGVSRTARPPIRWSEQQNVRWKVPIEGQGTSTPIVWDDRVFVLTAVATAEKDASIPDPQDQPRSNFFDIKRPNQVHDFVVLCLHRATGQEIWRAVATSKVPHEGAHNDNDFASASPVTDGKRLFCWFGSAGLFAYSLDGERLWQRDLGEATVGSSLGEGCSPVLHGNRLVVLRDHSRRGSIACLDAASGETLWEHTRDEDNAWATPLIVEHSGRTQVITAASRFVRSYDLTTGDVIWQCGGLTGNVTPCPVRQGDHVICMSGYQGHAAVAIPLSATGDLTGSAKIAWSADRGTPYVPSPVLYDGLLYFNQSNQAILRCLNAGTGETVFGPQRLTPLSSLYASPVGADGRLYFVGRNGRTLVLQRSSSYERLALNTLDDRFDASPAVVGRQLFLRGARFLYCLEETP